MTSDGRQPGALCRLEKIIAHTDIRVPFNNDKNAQICFIDPYTMIPYEHGTIINAGTAFYKYTEGEQNENEG